MASVDSFPERKTAEALVAAHSHQIVPRYRMNLTFTPDIRLHGVVFRHRDTYTSFLPLIEDSMELSCVRKKERERICGRPSLSIQTRAVHWAQFEILL
jgi:hypothetical protein